MASTRQRRAEPGPEGAGPPPPPASAGRRKVVIITGLSGAGKTNALQAFEDAGYLCIDNLPPAMIPAALQTAGRISSGAEGVVVVMDMRGWRYFGEELESSLDAVGMEAGWDRRVVFLEADDPTLVRRYKESRRPHPAARNGDVLEAIRSERVNLAGLREKADLVLDTSGYTALDVRVRFKALAESLGDRLTVSLVSFGFKHGIPLDVDALLDVRFLPNPHYDPELRPLTGHDQKVRAAVLETEDGAAFLRKTRDLLDFLIPRYASEGKTYFTLGIGCTGGRHRSVAITEEISRSLSGNAEIHLNVRHRDLGRA